MEEGCGGAGRVAAKEGRGEEGGGEGREGGGKGGVGGGSAWTRGHALEVLKVSNFLTGGECIGA